MNRDPPGQFRNIVLFSCLSPGKPTNADDGRLARDVVGLPAPPFAFGSKLQLSPTKLQVQKAAISTTWKRSRKAENAFSMSATSLQTETSDSMLQFTVARSDYNRLRLICPKLIHLL